MSTGPVTRPSSVGTTVSASPTRTTVHSPVADPAVGVVEVLAAQRRHRAKVAGGEVERQPLQRQRRGLVGDGIRRGVASRRGLGHVVDPGPQLGLGEALARGVEDAEEDLDRLAGHLRPHRPRGDERPAGDPRAERGPDAVRVSLLLAQHRVDARARGPTEHERRAPGAVPSRVASSGRGRGVRRRSRSAPSRVGRRRRPVTRPPPAPVPPAAGGGCAAVPTRCPRWPRARRRRPRP